MIFKETIVAEVILEIDDNKIAALKERAAKYGLNTDQFLKASIEDLLNVPDQDFKSAALRVLEKNKELYRRLS